MKTSWLALGALLVLAGYARGFAAAGFKPEVVGGEPAREGEFPYLVSLQEYSDHFCGGTLISPRWVLTAAHCASDLSESEAVVGPLWIDDVAEGERHAIARVLIHPLYKADGRHDYDFALLELDRPSGMRPLAVNWAALVIPEGEQVFGKVVGWGATRENGVLSPHLRKVSVPLVTEERCERAYPGRITERMFCAGYEAGGKDACSRDSGGPLILTGLNGEPILAGVVSFGLGCARPGVFGVYGRVSSVGGWIRENIGE